MEKYNKIHGYPGTNKQGGRPKAYKGANNVWTSADKAEEPIAVPSLPGLSQDQSRQLFQFLSNLTATGGSSRQQEEEEVNALAAYMAGISHILKSIHCLCALGHDDWILDSGASEHMCSKEATLHDLSLLQQPILVNLPNGSQAKVIKLRLTKDLS